MPARWIVEAPWTVSPFAGIRHPDAWRHRDAGSARATAHKVNGPVREVFSVLLAREPHRAGEAPRPVESDVRVEAGDRFTGAQEHGVPSPLVGARDVEAFVHSVDEEDVRVPLFAEERARAAGEPRASVAGEVPGPTVGLGLDDAGDAGAAWRRFRESRSTR